VVNVTDCADVAVGFTAVKLFLCHASSASLFGGHRPSFHQARV